MTGATTAPARPAPTSRAGAFFLLVPRSAVRAPALTLTALVVGGVAYLAPATRVYSFGILYAALLILGLPVVLRTLRGMLRGHFAADVVAMLAIATAMILREPIAGLVIVLMQTGGELLERYAEGRASDAVRELEAAAPRVAHRLRGISSADIEDVAADAVRVEERILVRPGEMVPCDAIVSEGTSSLDTSRITGEPVPERVGPGSTVRSGVVNLQSPLVLKVTAPAKESLYARIVELVRTAQAEKSPIQRLADRWAIWFTPLTLAVCALAWWLSGDATRVLAVLVVATPCPLILATPVAVIGGINRAARWQIIVRNGSALELLARVDTAVFDKTGTLTIGRPEVAEIATVDSECHDGRDHASMADALLSHAAAVEAGSGHLLARSVVQAAQARGLSIPPATDVVEAPGRGVSGKVEGRTVTVGSLGLVRERHPNAAARLETMHGTAVGLRAYVAADDIALGIITFADRLRNDLPAMFARLRRLGLERTVLLSGDHTVNVAPIAAQVGISEARGDLLPEDKVEAVRALEREGHRVLMVGDGTNDAPALSAATVGAALAAHGGGISAEAAGVVLLADDVTRIAEAVAIGQDTVRIARQSIGAGLALSGAAMIVAAFGYIPPTAGALLQEAIDVAVIVNALRASRHHARPASPAS